MEIQSQFSEQDVDVRRIERDGTVEFVADLGDAEASVDIVDDTVIVVAGDDQYDLEMADASDAQAFMKNGVLTIEVRA